MGTPPPRWPMVSRLRSVLVRTSVIVSTIVFLYLAVGTLMFPEWFYSLLWQQRYRDSDYWRAGLDFWLTVEPFWFYVGITALAAALIIAYKRRPAVYRFIDRFAVWIAAWCIAGVAITTLAVRIYGAKCLPAEQIYAMASELTLKEIGALNLNPQLQAPIDFHYVDGDRVKSLYNEIEQDLVEQERTVGNAGKVEGKVGAKAGAAEAEIGGSRQQNSSSTYRRLEFSPERECVRVMNFVLQGNNLKYLRTSDDWLRRRQAADFQRRYDEILKRAIPSSQNAPIASSPDRANKATDDEEVVAAELVKVYRAELRSMLASLEGLVFVDGDFTISRTSQATVTLLEQYSSAPRVMIKVTASTATGFGLMAGRAHLRVFGTVIRPLEDNAPIEVRPIAVF
jgi:hypothetical protein